MNKKISKSFYTPIACAFVLLSFSYTLEACSPSPSKSNSPQTNYTQPKQNVPSSETNQNNFSKEARDDMDDTYKNLEKSQDSYTNSQNSIKNHDNFMEREKELQRQKEKN